MTVTKSGSFDFSTHTSIWQKCDITHEAWRVLMSRKVQVDQMKVVNSNLRLSTYYCIFIHFILFYFCHFGGGGGGGGGSFNFR